MDSRVTHLIVRRTDAAGNFIIFSFLASQFIVTIIFEDGQKKLTVIRRRITNVTEHVQHSATRLAEDWTVLLVKERRLNALTCEHKQFHGELILVDTIFHCCLSLSPVKFV